MKKQTLGIAVAALALVVLSGCSGTGSSPSSSAAPGAVAAPDSLISQGKLTACIDPEYPPLEYYADGSGGEIIGFDADGIRALAAHWGVTPELVPTSFDGLMPGLQTRSCDLIFGGLYQSEERAQVTDSVAVMNAGPAVLASPAVAPTLTKPEDLCGKNVVSQAASSNSTAVAKLSEQCVADGKPAIAHTEYPKTAETVLAVINGKADALVETNVAAAYMVTQNQGQLALAEGVFEPDTTFGVFVTKGSPLLQPLTEAMRALYDDGTFAELATKYELSTDIVDVY